MKVKILLVAVLLCASVLKRTVAYGQQHESTACGTGVAGCDTVGVKTVTSPWRVGGFIGPVVAFCGSWERSFNVNKARDKALFNGIGFNAALNADYIVNRNDSTRLKWGVGAVAGWQSFFLRKDLDPFIDRIVSESASSQAVVRKGASEDHYLAIGPVLSYALTSKPRSLFLEASVRAGIFRTTPASIFVYDRLTGANIYSVTATDKRYHTGLLATLGAFVPSKNGLWAWGIEAMGFRTKLNYIFPGATVYPFQRKHGGFSAGVAMRRKFVRDVPVKKEPTPALNCFAPELELSMAGKSIKGMRFDPKRDTTQTGPITLSWKSLSPADSSRTERFTARIHRLNQGADRVIASVVCQDTNTLAFPADFLDTRGLPIAGQYYATVQSQSFSNCASCTSEASTTGFSVLSPVIDSVKYAACFKQCNLEIYTYRTVNSKRVVYGKSPASCAGCICPVDTVPRKSSKYYLLGTIQVPDCNPADLDINQEIAKNNIVIPSWAKSVYASLQTIVAGECQVPQGISVKKNFKADARKGKIGQFIEQPAKQR